MRTKAYSTILIPLLAAICVIGFIDTAAADNENESDRSGALAKAEIAELMSCYAYSFDTLRRAVTAIYSVDTNLELLDSRNMADPYFAEAYELFSSCTTEDFVVEAFRPDGTPLLLEGWIPAGPLPWVNLINSLRAEDDQAARSQHHFGSLSTTARGGKGTLKAYAIISGSTTLADGEIVTSGPNTSTYTSDVVYQGGKWLLKKTTLFPDN
jgi:hypothetical protein